MPEPEDFEIPEEAGQLLDQFQAEEEAKEFDQDDAKNREELLDWATTFITESKAWRSQSYERKWEKFQRMADSKNEPDHRENKQPWQSTPFVPVTASHRETIKARLIRTLFGPRPALEVKSRKQEGDDQSENIRDLTLRDMEKTKLEVEADSVIDEATTYGSGFARIRYEEKTEPRMVRRPVFPEAQIPLEGQELPEELQPESFESSLEDVLVYRGVRFEWISIWDVFPDPKALRIKGNAIAYRFYLKYGDIVKGAEKGYYLPDAVEALKNTSDEVFPEDKQTKQGDRDIAESDVTRPDYAKRVEVYELFARLPQRWILPVSQISGDPDALIPARIIFNEKTLIAIEASESYDGEPPILKLDYFKVAGQFYARGIPEMLEDPQAIINSITGARLDNLNILLNKKYGVIERAVVDPKDFDAGLGGAIRIKGQNVQDIRQAIMELPFSDVTASTYRESQEWERFSQERSSANRVTIGTAGQVKDANQTLGGMQLLMQSAGEKFAYIGMIMEFDFMQEVARAFWKEIYANIQPEDIVDALGEERAATFRLTSPEEFEKDYAFIPQGIFTMENKALQMSRLQSIYALFQQEPFANKVQFFDRMMANADEDPDKFKLSEEDMRTMMLAQASMMGNFDGPGGMPADVPDEPIERDAAQTESLKSGQGGKGLGF